MNGLSERLKQVLTEHGAVLVGYGDMSDLVRDPLDVGVAIGMPMPADMVRSIEEDPTKEYSMWYHETNDRLNKAINAGAALLRAEGYEVREQTTDKVKPSAEGYTPLPHKSVAIRAGLGWIGKSGLLITPEFGGALRISSLLTDAPLTTGQADLSSHCGACTICRDSCPYDALKGSAWEPGIARDALFDYERCRSGALSRCRELLGADMTICGKCFAFCPHTRAYIEG